MNDYIVCVGGDDSRAAFLIRGTVNVLYDTGMAYSAGNMIHNIKKELGKEPLSAVLLSHSHYDHVSGLPFLRKEWPELTVYGSEHAKKILDKPSAKAVMRRLSHDAAKGAGLLAEPEYSDEDLSVDVTVKDGDVLTFGEHAVTVFETPGHTRCSVSYMADDDVVFASETVGVSTREVYMPCYMVGYQMALDAVEKLRNCGAKRILMSHVGILEGEPAVWWDYLEAQIRRTKDEIIGIIQTYRTQEERLHAMYRNYHAGVRQGEQPDFAFYLNAAATLKLVEQECMGGKR